MENWFLKVAQPYKDSGICLQKAKPLGGACDPFLIPHSIILYIVFASRAMECMKAAETSQTTGLGGKPAFVYCCGALGKLNNHRDLNGNL